MLSNIKSQEFVDTGNIFLMGESQGGVVSTMVAAEHNDDIKGMILIYPAFVLFDDAYSLFTSRDDIPDTYNQHGFTVGKTYFERSLDYDIYPTMKKVTKPVLILHGDADDIAPLSYSERAIKTFPDASLEVIQGIEHYFNPENNERALTYIEPFIARNTK